MAKEPAFVRARQEWDDRYADLARGKRNWQLTACALLVAHLVTSSALAWLATQSRVQPYVVEVDRQGQAVAIGPAEALADPEERLLRFQLGLYIHDLRGVLADAAAQRRVLDRAYGHTRGPAIAFLNRHFREHNPFERARRQRVAVQLRSLLPLSEDSWQVQWDEISQTPDGREGESTSWQAILTVEIDPPTSTARLLENPLGLFVTEIHWTQTL